MRTQDLTGQILGSYRLEALLGRGPVAVVYQASHLAIPRKVAIKVIFPSNDAPAELMRTQREIEIISKLEHPHILPLTDYVVDKEKNISYMIMRLLTGGSLADRIREYGALPKPQVIKTARQIGRALDFTHRQGIVHRDVKPTNILFDDDDNAYLSDFGFAQIGSITDENFMLETALCLSPESIMGEVVTGQADIYSFGAALYEMITGSSLFTEQELSAIILDHLNEKPLAPTTVLPSLPQALDAVFEKVLAKNPADRYATATDFVDSLEEAFATKVTNPGARRIFISYSRRIHEVRQLADMLKSLGYEVWFDTELTGTGGQRWWDNILEQIRTCDLFIFALSAEALDSEACRREYTYAAQLNKNIFPILISQNAARRALPKELAQIQWVELDSPHAMDEIQASVEKLHPFPLPDDLPLPPSAPLKRIHELADEITQLGRLSLREQLVIIIEIKSLLEKGEDVDAAFELLHNMSNHDDIRGQAAKEIDELLKKYKRISGLFGWFRRGIS